METVAVLAAPPARPPGMRTRLRVLGLTQSATDPASRFRFVQFMPHLERAGWQVEHRPNRPDREWRSHLNPRAARAVHYRLGRGLMRLSRFRDVEAAGGYDVVFVNRDLAGAGSFLERRLLQRNPRVVFDFDDAIFVGPRNEALIRWLCANAAWVTPGNEYLAEWAGNFTDRVTVLPTVIDTERYASREAVDPPGELVRVGWSGSDSSIGVTLLPYLDLLARLQAALPFDLVVVSNTRPQLPTRGLRWSFRPWSPSAEGRIGEWFDIGIMPLLDNEFQRGKCGLKLLQYMAAGLPAVASPVGVNARIVQHGMTGYLASAPDDWGAALEALIRSPEARARMGAAGRSRCEEHFSVRRWLPELMAVLSRAAGAGAEGT